jgi:hypothetical protein
LLRQYWSCSVLRRYNLMTKRLAALDSRCNAENAYALRAAERRSRCLS